MRRLTLEEAEIVAASARDDRPLYFNAQTKSEEPISTEFESFLILTPISTRSNVSSFLQVIVDNNPNQIDVRNELISEFLEEERRNELERQRVYGQLTEYYDRVRSDLSSSLEGFTDIQESTLLQEALTKSLGDIVASRDRHQYNYAVLSVLNNRLEAETSEEFEQELRSWIRVLVEYD